jgi:glycosyltransferase involved in cell wall biosynthesis
MELLKQIKNRLLFVKDVFANLLLGWKYDLFFIVENSNWVIDAEGGYITKNLNDFGMLKAKTTLNAWGLRNKIIHFGSVNTFISKKGIKKIHPSNKIVLTWFHIAPEDSRIKYIKELNKKVNYVHTSCNITRDNLIKHGLDEKNIVIVPISADLENFKPTSSKEKIRKEFSIEDDGVVIGSFQKDGNGWGEGLEPKLIKGPDIFCDVLEKLAKKYKIMVLLTGPARGYVKKRLSDAKIPFIHNFLENYLDVVKYYQAIDLYLVASREEGGPKAVLESMATGIPIISTRVGMAPDMIENNIDGILADIEDTDALAAGAEKIIQDKLFRESLVQNAFIKIKKYDIKNLTRDYYNKIYSKLR